VELKSAVAAAPELTTVIASARSVVEVNADPVIDNAVSEEFQQLIDRSREEIARAGGISADRVRIIIEY
jgi:hypothetical protein